MDLYALPSAVLIPLQNCVIRAGVGMFSFGEHAYYFYCSLIELNGGTQLLSNICEAHQWQGHYRKSATFLLAPIDNYT